MQALRKIADKLLVYLPDPAVFNDEIASRTSWSEISNGFYLKGLGPGYQLSYYTNKYGRPILGYRKTVLFSTLISTIVIFGLCCFMLFLSAVHLYIFEPDTWNTPNDAGLTILLLFLSFLTLGGSSLAFTRASKTPFFDKNDQTITYGDKKIFFSDVYAIQINPVAKNIQFNLVLQDASRVALKCYYNFNFRQARQDALQIADYIGLPTTRIWDRSVAFQNP